MAKIKIGLSNTDKENMKDEVVERVKMLTPAGITTAAVILAFTEQKGVWIASDTGHWYYWNGTQYVDSGYLYQAEGGYTEMREEIDEFKEEFTSDRIGLLSVQSYNDDTGIIKFIIDDDNVNDYEYDSDTGILTISV